MSAPTTRNAKVTPKAMLWVSAFLAEYELRRQPLDGRGVRLAARLANSSDPEADALAYWTHTEARGDSPRDALLAKLRAHPGYNPEMERGLIRADDKGETE